VSSRLIRKVETTDEMIEEIEATLLGDGFVRVNDTIVIISGSPMWVTGTTNLLKLHRVGERRRAPRAPVASPDAREAQAARRRALVRPPRASRGIQPATKPSGKTAVPRGQRTRRDVRGGDPGGRGR